MSNRLFHLIINDDKNFELQEQPVGGGSTAPSRLDIDAAIGTIITIEFPSSMASSWKFFEKAEGAHPVWKHNSPICINAPAGVFTDLDFDAIHPQKVSFKLRGGSSGQTYKFDLHAVNFEDIRIEGEPEKVRHRTQIIIDPTIKNNG